MSLRLCNTLGANVLSRMRSPNAHDVPPYVSPSCAKPKIGQNLNTGN